jgi:hypothetical protein
MRKKFQTSVRPDGSTNVVQLGYVAEDRLDADKSQERHFAAKLAMKPAIADTILEIVETDETLVRVYQSGTVRVTHWVAQSE